MRRGEREVEKEGAREGEEKELRGKMQFIQLVNTVISEH